MTTVNTGRRRPQTFIAAGVALLVLVYLTSNLASFNLPPLSTPLSNQNTSSTASWPILDVIPPKIWQIYFGYSPIGDQIGLVDTWILKNQDYSYTLMSDDGANAFARKNYAQRPDVLQTFLELKLPVFRSDLLRYMLLETEGGIYSDLDTDALHPVKDWVPAELKSRVHAIVGVEYDQLDQEAYTGMPEPLQFCQWTIATSQGHPIMKKAVARVVEAIRKMADDNGTAIAELQPMDRDVVKVTGPVIWTAVVLDSLSEVTGTNVTYLNLTGMTEPKLFGDIYVLPVNGFGAGQPHSNSWHGDGNPPEAMTRHIWKGSWKHGLGNKFTGA